jgi:hypothetical protein
MRILCRHSTMWLSLCFLTLWLTAVPSWAKSSQSLSPTSRFRLWHDV